MTDFAVADIDIGKTTGRARTVNPRDHRAFAAAFLDLVAEQGPVRQEEPKVAMVLPSAQDCARNLIKAGVNVAGAAMERGFAGMATREDLIHEAIREGDRAALSAMLDRDPDYVDQHPELSDEISRGMTGGAATANKLLPLSGASQHTHVLDGR